ncbi:T9SS type A sorting domain-containing protein [Membranicola marinus]|uniref:T9SS type A sorting domain-containing protein n=1 Tax=Membranihabitans marinus TaxID=1227546 RepID=A0A953HMD1_9BACT|nr:T9SS type A sorting domain-containing protein [Membranihabitans marinus]MBY5957739.1 T9SS type A sorting domain-containing protein [Membranihabitans marinus]
METIYLSNKPTLFISLIFLFIGLPYYGQNTANINAKVLFEDEPLTNGVTNFIIDITNTTINSHDYDFTKCEGGIANITLDYQTGLNNYEIEITPVPSSWMGINTQDIILIQQYIQGLETFDNYQYVAADADKNGLIDTVDINKYRAYILDPRDTFPGGNHWYLLHDIEHPFFESDNQDVGLLTYLDTIWNSTFTGDPSSSGKRPYFTFRGIRRGDLNGSNCGYCINDCGPSQLKKYNDFSEFQNDSRIVQVDFIVDESISTSGFEILLEDFSEDQIKIARVSSDLGTFSQKNYSINDKNGYNKEFRSSWISQGITKLESGQSLLTFEIKLHNLHSFLDLKRALNRTIVNLYDENADWKSNTSVALKNIYRDSPMFTAYPNPFTNQISIEFDRKSNKSGRIDLVDVHGKIMISKNYKAQKGYNSFILSTADLASGIYIVRQIEDNRIVSSKKIIK